MADFKLWTILFLCVAFQGLFLSFLIASRKNPISKKGNFFLSVFIALFSIIMLFWIGHWNGFFDEKDIYTFIYRPVPLLLGPFLFYYIKSFFAKVTDKELVHLLPFLLITCYFLPVYLNYGTVQNPYHSLWAWNLLSPFILSLNTISTLFYSAYLIFFYQIRRKAEITDMKEGTLKLIRLMIIFFGVFALAAVFNLWTRMTWPNHPIIFDFTLSGLISVFIYFIGYLGFNSPALMLSFEKNITAKYAGSGLKANEADELLSRLISHLEKHRPYISEDYKISQLSSETNISSHHISELLNQYLKKSFSDVINGYRIEEAKRLLNSGDFRHKKISSVGFEVGFSSPSTFYSWFKKLTGTSPAQYHKDLKS